MQTCPWPIHAVSLSCPEPFCTVILALAGTRPWGFASPYVRSPRALSVLSRMHTHPKRASSAPEDSPLHKPPHSVLQPQSKAGASCRSPEVNLSVQFPPMSSTLEPSRGGIRDTPCLGLLVTWFPGLKLNITCTFSPSYLSSSLRELRR